MLPFGALVVNQGCVEGAGFLAVCLALFLV